MALWPPSLINCDKSSLSAGAFKVSDWHCALKIKNHHELKRVESTADSLRQISGMFLLIIGKWLSKAMRYIVCCALFLFVFVEPHAVIFPIVLIFRLKLLFSCSFAKHVLRVTRVLSSRNYVSKIKVRFINQ